MMRRLISIALALTALAGASIPAAAADTAPVLVGGVVYFQADGQSRSEAKPLANAVARVSCFDANWALNSRNAATDQFGFFSVTMPGDLVDPARCKGYVDWTPTLCTPDYGPGEYGATLTYFRLPGGTVAYTVGPIFCASAPPSTSP